MKAKAATMGKGKGLPLAQYQESRIRQVHQTLLKWIEK
jgi:hypothetical protein